MDIIPKTRPSFFPVLGNSEHEKWNERWKEFYELYKPLLAAWLHRRNYAQSLNSLDIAEIINLTMAVLVKKFSPGKDCYKYQPETKGPFHSYILMIAENKAKEFIRKRSRESEKRKNYKGEFDVIQNAGKFTNDDKQLLKIAEIAKHQVLTSDSVSVRDREIFRRTTGGESPEAVAEAFGITRNNVDQIKNRLMKRVREVAEELNKAD